MSNHERSDTSNVEILLTKEAMVASRAVDRVIENSKIALKERHKDKPFHGPEHSMREGFKEDMETVAGRVHILSRLMRESFSRSLEFGTPEENDKNALFFSALNAGVAIHDRVMRFQVKEGKVLRLRGITEGGNEHESYIEGEGELLDAIEDPNNPFVPFILRVMRQTVDGTYPDRFDFKEIDPDSVMTFPENVETCLWAQDTEGNSFYKCLYIDSSFSDSSLAALLASTSDLGDALISKKFQETGNAEFFESETGVVADCVNYQGGAPIPRERGKQILNEMKNWRKVQVGVAFGQKARLLDKYTQENISKLFAGTFGRVPEVEEVSDFIDKIKTLIEGIDETVMDAADIYDDYVARFDSLSAEGPEYFTLDEQALFLDAIEFMNGDKEVLEKYSRHVEVAQERLV